MKARKICPLATRIKKMMQMDDDVGKISQATPILIGRAMELFLEKLCRQAITVAQSRQAKTLTPSHLKAAVKADNTMDFLAELVAPAPDLPAADPDNDDVAPKPTKRRRTKDSGDGLTSPEGQGRRRSSTAATTSGQASDDTPPGGPNHGRSSKPPLPPGGQAPPSRGAGGSRKESTGRRGPRRKAAAVVGAADASEPGSSSAAELTESVPQPAAASPQPLSAIRDAPCEAPAPGPVTTATGKVSKQQEAVLKHETPTAAAAGGPVCGSGPSSAAEGGAGISIVATLRAQQPFFGLGRKGKNLGGKGSSSSAAPSPASAHQLSPSQPMVEASACTGTTLPSEDVRMHPALYSYPLKLEPLDLSAVQRLVQDSAAARFVDASVSPCNGNGLGAELDACGSITGTSGNALSVVLQRNNSGALGAPSITTGLELGAIGDAGTVPGHLGAVGSCGGTSGPAAIPFIAGPSPPALGGCSAAGALLGSLGASIPYFQAPQLQGGMDDDYDDYDN